MVELDAGSGMSTPRLPLPLVIVSLQSVPAVHAVSWLFSSNELDVALVTALLDAVSV